MLLPDFIFDPRIIGLLITFTFGLQLIMVFRNKNRKGMAISFGVLICFIVFISFLDNSSLDGFSQILAFPILLGSAVMLFIYFMLVKYAARNKKIAYCLYGLLTLCGVSLCMLTFLG